jgi:predicted N-acetyltransferase YhbS
MGSAATPAPSSSRREETGSRGVPDEGIAFSTSILAETDADIAAREALLDRAMGPRRRKKSSEKLRRGRRPSEGLAFVARDAAGTVVGTVRLWDVGFERDVRAPLPPLDGEGGREAAGWGDNSRPENTPSASLRSAPPPSRGRREPGSETTALLLGPLAVCPTQKSAGIGSALMRHAIAEARRLGHGAILLVGDAPYYARFGFSAEKTGRLAMPGPYERERFLALELAEGALDGACGTLKAVGRKLKSRRRMLLAA